MSNSLLRRALGAFAKAGTVAEYEAAKRMGARLDGECQLLAVDAAISCRRRLEGMGVL